MFDVHELSRDKLFREVGRKDVRLRLLVGHISILDWFGSGWRTGIDEERGQDGEEGEEFERREAKRVSRGIENSERAVRMNSEPDVDEVDVDDSGWTWVQREGEDAIPIYTSEIDQDERAVNIRTSEVDQDEDKDDEDRFESDQDEDDEETDSDEESDDCLFMSIPRKYSQPQSPFQHLKPLNILPSLPQRTILPSPQDIKETSPFPFLELKAPPSSSRRVEVKPPLQYDISTLVYGTYWPTLTFLIPILKYLCGLIDAAAVHVRVFPHVLPNTYGWIEGFRRCL
ncbi:hypothetical protein MMC14_006148 [Varicellaria rhodocarpa]|nr:hypothetical protein [Varicellaria rhodocarpa]